MSANEQVAFLVALDGAVVGWGAGAESLFGYQADELVGQPVSVLAAPEGTSAFPRILSAVARGEGVEANETMVGKDGTRFEVALAVSPVLCVLFLKNVRSGRDNLIVRGLRGGYLKVLGLCLDHPWLTLGGFAALTVVTAGAGAVAASGFGNRISIFAASRNFLMCSAVTSWPLV